MREPQEPLDSSSSFETEMATPPATVVDPGSVGALPGGESAPETSSVLELRFTDQSRWQDLVDLLLARAERFEGLDRSRVLQQIASTYETKLGDLDSAFVTLEAAHADDPANEEVFDWLVRLAGATNRTGDLEPACRRALEVSPRRELALVTLEHLARSAERWKDLAQLLARHADLASDRPAEAARLLAELATISEQYLGSRERARQAWEDALRHDPSLREAVLALERIYADGSDMLAYLEILERRVEFVESDAEFVAIQQHMAELWETRMHKPLRACQAFEKILVVQPSDAHVQRELGRLYRQEQQWQDLAQLYRRQVAAASARDEQAELTYRMGEAWERFGDLEEATRAYGETLTIVPDHADALAAVARLSELAGELGEAYEAMLKRLPGVTDRAEQAGMLHRMGVIALAHLHEPTTAERHWWSAIELEPKRLETLRALAQLYLDRGQTKEATDVLAQVAEACPDGSEKVAALIEAAVLHRGPLEDTAKAFELYAQALDLDRGNVPAAEGLVEVAFTLEEWGSVVRFAERLLKPPQRGESRPARSEADAARLHLTLAKAAQHLGDVTKATQHYRRAAQLDAGLQPDLSSWADALFEKKEWGGAAALYDIVYQQRVASAPPAERLERAYRLGRARLELGERRAATEALQAAVDVDGRHKPSLESLARVRQELGDHRGAVAAKTALLELVDSADERFTLMCEVGVLLRDKLADRQGAIGFFLRAAEIRPEDQHLLHLVLELHTAERRWADAVLILKRLAASTANAKVRSRALVAAGKICHVELDRPHEAVDLFEEALDVDPSDIKTFSRIVKIFTEQKAWQRLEAAYRRMIRRRGDPTSASERAALAQLWRSLSAIHRSHLGDMNQASAALDTAAALEREPSVVIPAPVAPSAGATELPQSAHEPAPPAEVSPPLPALPEVAMTPARLDRPKKRPTWVTVAVACLGGLVLVQAGVIAFVSGQREPLPPVAVTPTTAPAPAPAGTPIATAPRPAKAPASPPPSSKTSAPSEPAEKPARLLSRNKPRPSPRVSARHPRRAARASAKSARSPARAAAKAPAKKDLVDDFLNKIK
ncbi:MAG: hypothetical protein KA712_08415 [Myxococcales bacterium]|nr:hypothetical protein [Myxococcales bacterium]